MIAQTAPLKYILDSHTKAVQKNAKLFQANRDLLRECSSILSNLVELITKSTASGYMVRNDIASYGSMLTIPVDRDSFIKPLDGWNKPQTIKGVAFDPKDGLIVFIPFDLKEKGDGLKMIEGGTLEPTHYLLLIQEVQLWLQENNITDLDPE
jgi:hypothetical protein